MAWRRKESGTHEGASDLHLHTYRTWVTKHCFMLVNWARVERGWPGVISDMSERVLSNSKLAVGWFSPYPIALHGMHL